jgi:hypothetical protein
LCPVRETQQKQIEAPIRHRDDAPGQAVTETPLVFTRAVGGERPLNRYAGVLKRSHVQPTGADTGMAHLLAAGIAERFR